MENVAVVRFVCGLGAEILDFYLQDLQLKLRHRNHLNEILFGIVYEVSQVLGNPSAVGPMMLQKLQCFFL
jgi:hypothetical protein